MYKVQATYLPRADMRFDFDYYFREHVDLAKRQLAGRVRINRIGVETRATELFDGGKPQAPLVFSIYVETAADVEDFRRFMASPAVEPLRADVVKYTNCDIVWTVSEYVEA